MEGEIRQDRPGGAQEAVPPGPALPEPASTAWTHSGALLLLRGVALPTQHGGESGSHRDGGRRRRGSGLAAPVPAGRPDLGGERPACSARQSAWPGRRGRLAAGWRAVVTSAGPPAAAGSRQHEVILSLFLLYIYVLFHSEIKVRPRSLKTVPFKFCSLFIGHQGLRTL